MLRALAGEAGRSLPGRQRASRYSPTHARSQLDSGQPQRPSHPPDHGFMPPQRRAQPIRHLEQRLAVRRDGLGQSLRVAHQLLGPPTTLRSQLFIRRRPPVQLGEGRYRHVLGKLVAVPPQQPQRGAVCLGMAARPVALTVDPHKLSGSRHRGAAPRLHKTSAQRSAVAYGGSVAGAAAATASSETVPRRPKSHLKM